jgi:predicted TIM-barrel fold metal-dependent hydrolase
MPVVDVDTHIDEPEEAWASMTGTEGKFRPITIAPPEGVEAPGLGAAASRWWLVDGRLRQRMIRDDDLTGTTLESRELLDVNVRLAHMDQLGVDIHVIYPTFFLAYVTGNPEAEVALAKSYCEYLARKCAESQGRLRWVAVLPFLDIEASIALLRWAKEHGACGVFKRGLEHGKRASDPYFFPVYEEAMALGLPICVHTGNGNPTDGRIGHGDGLGGVPVMDAFHALVLYNVPQKFPTLRFGFFEAGSTWLPYVIDRLMAEKTRRHWVRQFELGADLFRSNRFFVAIDPVEDISHVLTLGTEDFLMIGSDYTHFDTSAQPDALQQVQGWVEEGRISESIARKILDHNPTAFYGF